VRVPDTETFIGVRARLLKDGFRRLLIGGEVRALEELRPAEAMGAAGQADVVVDRIALAKDTRGRLAASLEQAWAEGHGDAHLWISGRRRAVRQGLVCPTCARGFEPARPGLFSYQSPVGACPACRGFGRTLGIDWAKVIPDESLSISDGALRPWNGRSSEWERGQLVRFAKSNRIPLDVPWGRLRQEQREAVLEGEGTYRGGRYPGLRAWFRWMESRTYKMHVRVLLSRYRAYRLCTACDGARLNADALRYRVGGLDLAAWHRLEVAEAHRRLESLSTRSGQGELARRELVSRLGWLARVGLGYLGLDRQSRTLSGGEAQRVSLTAALGTGLTGALFVLDEPSVGLHPSDLPPLTTALGELARRGNAVMVLEHDPALIHASDRVLELGPGAGPEGGRLCFDGTPAALARRTDLPTGRVLGAVRAHARARRTARGWIDVRGASANNLADLDVRLPLGVLAAVCGPSGSGKSTLAEEIVHRTLAHALGQTDLEPAGAVRSVESGLPLGRVVLVDQAPLGRTSRGNAATYTRAWDVLRKRFAAEPDAVMRGFGPAHFSFNVDGGRCEACSGEGSETVEMQFLADVALTCPSCRGQRFKPEVLDVRLRGHSVSEVLGMTVDQALAVFEGDRPIAEALRPLQRLGLGYLPIGQPLSTLSGGEAQRVKLARALGGAQEGVLYVLDEPSAGLHGENVARVLEALHGLVEAGASVLAVDHDLDLLGSADWLVELGPGGGREGGRLVAEGPPEEVARRSTRTGEALRTAVGPRPAVPPLPPAGGAPCMEVEHAREHNLADVSCRIPLGKLVVLTGPSGSGKSTLAFDVIFAEAQRRFTETLSPYARQFLPTLPRPDVERIRGLPPAVALEQRTARAGATSTVATVTEVAHYLRLLFAKLGTPHCPNDDTAIAPRSAEQLLSEARAGRGSIELLAPVVRARKGTYLDVFTAAARAGVKEAVCDGARVSTDAPPKLARSREHTIDLVVWSGPAAELPGEAFRQALRWGQGAVKVLRSARERLLSSERSCPRCGTAVPELDPRWFSFNTAQGRCEDCEGTGLEGAGEEGESTDPCPACDGTRLQPIPRAVRLFDRRYAEVVQQPVVQALEEVRGWSFSGDAARVGAAALGELVRRLEFLERVGLGYLSLDRAAATLSGGEMQRLRLSAQAGAGLTGALYVLDEPTIGLHPRDTGRLLENLRTLVDTGSTVLVVEHDLDTLRAADHLVDLGPGGGRLGGRIVAAGAPSEVLASEASPTARALQLPVRGTAPGSPRGPRLAPARRRALSQPPRRGPRAATRPDDGGGGRLRLGEEHAGAAGAVPGGARGARAHDAASWPLPAAVRTGAAPAGAVGGPVTHRADAAQRSGHLPRCLGRAAASVRRHSGGAGPRLRAGPLLVQLHRWWPLPDLRGSGRDQPRDVLPPRRHHTLRGVRRRALRAGDAGGPLAGAERGGDAAPHRGRGARGVLGAPPRRGPAPLPLRAGGGLPAARAGESHPVGWRGAAAEAGRGADRDCAARADPLRARRAHDGPAPRRRGEAAPRPRPARRARGHAGGHRAPPRRHRRGGPSGGAGTGGWRGRWTDRGRGDAGGDRPGENRHRACRQGDPRGRAAQARRIDARRTPPGPQTYGVATSSSWSSTS
jgi:excinuclease ABC subunit A